MNSVDVYYFNCLPIRATSGVHFKRMSSEPGQIEITFFSQLHKVRASITSNFEHYVSVLTPVEVIFTQERFLKTEWKLWDQCWASTTHASKDCELLTNVLGPFTAQKPDLLVFPSCTHCVLRFPENRPRPLGLTVHVQVLNPKPCSLSDVQTHLLKSSSLEKS